VQGDCYAGGMGLVAACDVVVAVDTANFCLSEVKLGLIPATISPYMIKAMGEQAARRYFLTAERFDAVEARRLGLVHELVGSDGLEEAARQVLAALRGNGPAAVRAAKDLVAAVAGKAPAEVEDDCAHRIATTRASDEGKEGVAAFLEKRKPSWLN